MPIPGGADDWGYERGAQKSANNQVHPRVITGGPGQTANNEVGFEALLVVSTRGLDPVVRVFAHSISKGLTLGW